MIPCPSVWTKKDLDENCSGKSVFCPRKNFCDAQKFMIACKMDEKSHFSYEKSEVKNLNLVD